MNKEMQTKIAESLYNKFIEAKQNFNLAVFATYDSFSQLKAGDKHAWMKLAKHIPDRQQGYLPPQATDSVPLEYVPRIEMAELENQVRAEHLALKIVITTDLDNLITMISSAHPDAEVTPEHEMQLMHTALKQMTAHAEEQLKEMGIQPLGPTSPMLSKALPHATSAAHVIDRIRKTVAPEQQPVAQVFNEQGKSQVWYQKPEFLRSYMFGMAPLPTIHANDLTKTHALVKTLDSVNLNGIFGHMQAEVWSPNGEARDLIVSLGLQHTSMSVGDIIVTDGQIFMVSTTGFKILHVAPA